MQVGDPTLKRRSVDELPQWKAILGDSACFVYFIGSHDFSAVKIGVAQDPSVRLAELQVGNPYELQLISVLPGRPEMERAFHHRAHGARVRGEWFDGVEIGALLDFVEELADKMRGHFRETGEMMELRFSDIAPVRPIWAKISTEWHGASVKQIAIRLGRSAADIRREIRAMYLSGLYEVPLHLSGDVAPKHRAAA